MRSLHVAGMSVASICVCVYLMLLLTVKHVRAWDV